MAYSNRHHNENGFAVPLAMGLGLIMILMATAAMVKSHEEKLVSSTQSSTAKALSAAQTGITRFQELIDDNKVIAMYPACAGTWNNQTCQDSGSVKSWAKAVNISELSPACPSAGATAVQSAATRSWTNISGTDSSLGQYRLIDYVYDSSAIPPRGTLTVEGRINQDGLGSSATASAGTATSRISIELPIQPGIPTVPDGTAVSLAPRFNSLDPAVWLGTNVVTDIGNLTVDGNILLSSSNCTISVSSGQPSSANLLDAATQTVMADPRSLPQTPDLPADDDSDHCDNDDSDDVLNCITSTELIAANEDANGNGTLDAGEDANGNGILDTGQLPRPGDIGDANNYYHYLVQDNLTLSGKDLNIVEGTKVILYVQGNITLDGTVNINQGNSNTSAFLEIYGNTDSTTPKYGCDGGASCPTTQVNFTGNGTIAAKAFIHTPEATVMASGTPTVNWTGALWADDWNDASSSMITLTPDDQYFYYSSIETLIDTSNSVVVAPIIYPPSVWETNEVQ